MQMYRTQIPKKEVRLPVKDFTPSFAVVPLLHTCSVVRTGIPGGLTISDVPSRTREMPREGCD